MEKINFINGQAPAINATNLNQLQTNVENEFKNTNVLKNLFSGYVSGYIDADSTNEKLASDSTALTSNWIEVKPNTKYTMSGDGNRSRWQFKSTNGTITYFTTSNLNTTITTNNDTKYVRIYFSSDGNFTWMQFEEGEAATLKVPYAGYVVESGKNSNGSWIKYDDGTMICSCHPDEKTIGTSLSDFWGFCKRTDTIVFTFPQAFITAPNVVATNYSVGGSFGVTMDYGSLSATQCGVQALKSPTATDLRYRVSYVAIGKWK